MWVIVLCILMVIAGLLAIARWGGMAVQPPPTPAGHEPGPVGRVPVGLVVRRSLCYLTLAVSAGARSGLPAAAALAARRAGRWRAFGALLLVLAGARLEPLRPGNPDFDLVGPGWVSVVAFAALVLFHGMLLAPTAAAVGAVAVLANQVPAVVAAWRDQRALTAGRVVLGLVALAALPSLAVAVADILGRP